MSDEQRKERAPSQATDLVRVGLDRYDFFTTGDGEPFAIPKAGPYVARSFRGGRDSLRAELAHSYIEKHDRAPSSHACADALLVLEGRCRQGEVLDPALRVARYDDGLVVDLGDDTGRAILIRPNGWEIVDPSPVLFKRTALTASLPVPIRGGDVNELREFINVDTRYVDLIVGYLITCLLPDIPHPIAAFVGEQGAGKTVTAKICVSVIDPSPVPLRKPPRDDDSWVTAAAGSWVVGIDNISRIGASLSDSLCRSVTGEGDVRRRLYTDSDLHVISFRRCVVLTGIDMGALRGDLGDRLLLIEMSRIDADKRHEDSDLTTLWHDRHPHILGGLLDLTCRVVKALPETKLTSMPRMADFAHVLAAVDHVTGAKTLDTYLRSARRVAEEVIDADPVATAVVEHVKQFGALEGPAAELLRILTPEPPARPAKDWPRSPQGMGGALTRVAPALRRNGIGIEHRRETSGRRVWTIRDGSVSNVEYVGMSKTDEKPRSEALSAPDNPSTSSTTTCRDESNMSEQKPRSDVRDNLDNRIPISSNGRPISTAPAIDVVLDAFPGSEIVEERDA